MKPLPGPTRSGNSEKYTSLSGSDAEERFEEDFDLPARSRFGEGRAATFNRSGCRHSKPLLKVILSTNEGSHCIHDAAFESFENSPLCVRDFSESFLQKNRGGPNKPKH